MMDTSNLQPATPEIVWAMLQEIAERQAKTERLLEEAGKQHTKNERLFEEIGKKRKETDRNLDKVGIQIKETNRQLGGMAYNQGRFAEEYFINSFEKGMQNFFGEKFDSIRKNEKAGLNAVIEDEYDILLINGKTVGIVEIKFKAHEKDIPVVLKKVDTFRANYPNYKNHKLYLGLATMSFYPELEKACQDNGIAIIKQAGDTVVIYDEHLKAY